MNKADSIRKDILLKCCKIECPSIFFVAIQDVEVEKSAYIAKIAAMIAATRDVAVVLKKLAKTLDLRRMSVPHEPLIE
jgi:hypothetical protein